MKMTIRLDTIDKVKGFVSTILHFEGDADLSSGRYTVDAKSILGIFSLELSQPLELELMEREFDLQYTNVIYVGGGAVAVKNFSESRRNVAFDTDIHANAKGYEFLAMQMLKKQGVA